MTKVTAALLLNNNQILIAKRRQGTKMPGKWEFPGGKIEDNETPEECLCREIQEEFQIDVTVEDYYCDSVYEYPHGTVQLLAYWVIWNNGDLTPTEHEETKWVTISELDNFDFAPADIPIVQKLKEEYRVF